MFNIFNHKENRNQSNIEISAHLMQNGYHQENKQQQMLVRIWKKRNTYTLLAEM
jgi:hypothetical protein